MEEEDHHIHTNIFASKDETRITYPDIDLNDYNPNFDSLVAYGGIEEHKKGNNFPATNSLGNQENDQIDDDSKGDERKYFSFESPVSYGVQAYGGIEEHKKGNNFPATNNLLSQEIDQIEDADSKGDERKYFSYDSPVSYGVQAYGGIEEHKKGNNFPATNNLSSQENDQIEDADSKGDERKYFSYELPVSEETGVWIPVSVPPMSESVREEWNKGLCLAGANFSDCDWDQFGGEEKEMTMWDVVLDMLLVAQGKVTSLASGDVRGYAISWMSDCILEQAWKEMAQTLTEANFGNTREILETEPPKWLADSAASACMLCSVRFHPIMCSRHHCRFCGGIFCNNCSRGRSLLPVKFRTGDPKRVCDVCCVRLESVQPYLIDQVSRASQVPTRDLTDLSTLRSWLNFPWGQSMEHEIYKATNAIRGYIKVGSLTPEKSIPESILKQAKGLAILTIAKIGMVMTYNIGTGLVVARRGDGSWSPPSAISTCGVGWGAQAGGEVTDFIIVLRNSMAVQTFGGNMHFSVGAGLSAAVGVVGRAAEADLRAGDGGYAACYTYSCSKGAFVGCSLEGSVVTTRAKENSRFYGNSSIKASDILLGLMPRPPAAAILYHALSDLYRRIET